MARTSLRDVAGLPDPQTTYNFDLFFDSIPGGAGVNSRGLAIRCMTTSIPGMQVDQITVPLHGVEVNYAGRQIYSKQFSATLHETRDNGIRAAIRGWVEYARNNRQNQGNHKAQYARTAEIVLYDDIPNETRRIKVFGCWPLSFDDLQLDGSQSTAAQYNVTFSFDYTQET